MQNHLFVKLKKCDVHQQTITFLGYVLSLAGAEMDQAKVQAITDWPEPTTIKELQHFLGFANFYRRFMRNYSTTVSPLTSSDPDVPFAVEVDASSCGICAVLSQYHGNPGKLHPCAFYSRKLTAAETNYHVTNWELLSMKAVLENWQHWVEGACHPFLILTYHCNLKYLLKAQQLKPRPAR